MDSREIVTWRRAHENDECECGHARGSHYGPQGDTRNCEFEGTTLGVAKRCICPAYRWADRPVKPTRMRFPSVSPDTFPLSVSPRFRLAGSR